MNYSQTKPEFKVGEIVWYIRDYWFTDKQAIVKAKINRIDDYANKLDPMNGVLFYWVTPKDVTLTDMVFDWYNYVTSKLLRQSYHPLWKYPQHALRAGDSLFRTEEEAKEIFEYYHQL